MQDLPQPVANFTNSPTSPTHQLTAVPVAPRPRPEYSPSMIKSGLARRVGAALFLAACSKSAPPAAAPLRTAQADVAQSRAQLAAARLNLSYATVTAPIAGRAGRAEVTEGALVSGAQGTLLTRIEQLDPIFANFSLSSSAVLDLRR